jgi:hypothetical protein
MKTPTKLTLIALSLAATGAFAEDMGAPRTDNGPNYRATGQEQSAFPTMGPSYYGEDIRNANSALWGVGG